METGNASEILDIECKMLREINPEAADQYRAAYFFPVNDLRVFSIGESNFIESFITRSGTKTPTFWLAVHGWLLKKYKWVTVINLIRSLNYDTTRMVSTMDGSQGRVRRLSRLL